MVLYLDVLFDVLAGLCIWPCCVDLQCFACDAELMKTFFYEFAFLITISMTCLTITNNCRWQKSNFNDQPINLSKAGLANVH